MKQLINSLTTSTEESMKSISFFTLVKMIKEGDAPSEITVDGETFIFDGEDYDNGDWLTDTYTLVELSNMTFTIE